MANRGVRRYAVAMLMFAVVLFACCGMPTDGEYSISFDFFSVGDGTGICMIGSALSVLPHLRHDRIAHKRAQDCSIGAGE